MTMIAEGQLRTSVNHLRQAINELRTASQEFQRAIDQRRNEVDKHVNELTQQISQADHDASDQKRSDQERTLLQQRSHVLRSEIDNNKQQFNQFEQDMRRLITVKDQMIQQLDVMARNIEQTIAHGVQ
jgi:predicted RNase H-like nuclease (RuvC/YqgF family)